MESSSVQVGTVSTLVTKRLRCGPSLVSTSTSIHTSAVKRLGAKNALDSSTKNVRYAMRGPLPVIVLVRLLPSASACVALTAAPPRKMQGRGALLPKLLPVNWLGPYWQASQSGLSIEQNFAIPPPPSSPAEAAFM